MAFPVCRDPPPRALELQPAVAPVPVATPVAGAAAVPAVGAAAAPAAGAAAAPAAEAVAAPAAGAAAAPAAEAAAAPAAEAAEAAAARAAEAAAARAAEAAAAPALVVARGAALRPITPLRCRMYRLARGTGSRGGRSVPTGLTVLRPAPSPAGLRSTGSAVLRGAATPQNSR